MSTVPVHPEFKTKAQRVNQAAGMTLVQLDSTRRELALGSRRKNLRFGSVVRVAEVYGVVVEPYAYHLLAKIKDGRVICFSRGPIVRTVVISHDLEHLWWYGLTQTQREAFQQEIDRCKKASSSASLSRSRQTKSKKATRKKSARLH